MQTTPDDRYLSTSSSSSSSDSRSSVLVPLRRKQPPRKSHTKSRRGCYTCKRRKIKCQESLPKCGHCEKAGFVCEYPRLEASYTTTSPGGATSGITAGKMLESPILQPQATPTVFSMRDMQYFHHFLTLAYPHLPVKADKLWTVDIPSVAHEVRTPTSFPMFQS
jgi:Zn(2)-Cys(6) binuclear cluster domain-containing protein